MLAFPCESRRVIAPGRGGHACGPGAVVALWLCQAGGKTGGSTDCAANDDDGDAQQVHPPHVHHPWRLGSLKHGKSSTVNWLFEPPLAATASRAVPLLWAASTALAGCPMTAPMTAPIGVASHAPLAAKVRQQAAVNGAAGLRLRRIHRFAARRAVLLLQRAAGRGQRAALTSRYRAGTARQRYH